MPNVLTTDKSAGLIRQTEEEADVYALYLMVRAGYDIDKAPGFWRRLGDKTGASILGDGTHPGTKARVALAQATIDAIHAQQKAGIMPTPPIPLLK